MDINRVGVIREKKEWGITDALFIDGKEVMTRPPISYDRIKKKIEKSVRKISRMRINNL